MSKNNSPEWKAYEKQVAQLVAALDVNAEVTHNKLIEGRLSSAMRQVDVWVRGKIIGQEITIAVECKMVSRPLEIGTIDEFVGKLLDLGADRGVLYSASGMTPNAVHRAEGATSPSVILVSLDAAPGPTPYGAPGPPDGLDEPDYPEWLSVEIYRRILVGKQWIESCIRDEYWEPDAKWRDIVDIDELLELDTSATEVSHPQADVSHRD